MNHWQDWLDNGLSAQLERMPPQASMGMPMAQRYREYARQRQMTLDDLLLENRIVFLAGVINDSSAIVRSRNFRSSANCAPYCFASFSAIAGGAPWNGLAHGRRMSHCCCTSAGTKGTNWPKEWS